VRRLERSLVEAIGKRGFSFVEVISPCPTYYGRWNKMGSALQQMHYYHDNSVISHGSDPADADVDLGGEVICGVFVDVDKPTCGDMIVRSQP
jgi:2-oxoglutarate ferredoxin oxidoreductase subunit beta